MAWELRIQRQRLQEHNGRVRTYGDYQLFVDGVEDANIRGHVCECMGPGLNIEAGRHHHLRIAARRYPLHRHSTEKYRTVAYNAAANSTYPMPAIRLGDTASRTGILIHPGHARFDTKEGEPPSDLYLSSVGCLNLTGPLKDDQMMDHVESRERVIAVIDALQAFVGAGFATASPEQPYANAFAIIDGEPMQLP